MERWHNPVGVYVTRLITVFNVTTLGSIYLLLTLVFVVVVSPCVAKGLNLIFLYQYMVRTLVPFRTSKILRIF